MATAPPSEETLTPNDAADVLVELLEAQNQSYTLGLTLGLPQVRVEAIHSTHQDPRDRLLYILIAFLEQVQTRSTWRVIVDALRSRAVNLPRLAERVESAHFPDPTTTPETIAVAASVYNTSRRGSYSQAIVAGSVYSTTSRGASYDQSVSSNTSRRASYDQSDVSSSTGLSDTDSGFASSYKDGVEAQRKASQDTQLMEDMDRKLAQMHEQLRYMETEKDELVQAKDRELVEAQQQLKKKETEKDEFIQARDRELAQILEEKVNEINELVLANEGKLAQARKEMREREKEFDDLSLSKENELAEARQKLREEATKKDELVLAKDRELAKAQRHLRQKETEKTELVKTKDRELAQAQQQLTEMETEKEKLVQAKDKEIYQAHLEFKHRETEKDELLLAKERKLAQAQQKLRQIGLEKDELVQAKDRELAQAQQELREMKTEKEQLVQAKERDIDIAQQKLIEKETEKNNLVQAKKEALAEAQNQLEQMKAEKNDLESELDRAKQTLRQLETEKDELEQAKKQDLAKARQQLKQMVIEKEKVEKVKNQQLVETRLTMKKMETEKNKLLQAKEKKLAGAQKQLREDNRLLVNKKLTQAQQQLELKEAEKTKLVQVKDRELAQAQQQMKEKDAALAKAHEKIQKLEEQLSTYRSHVSGPGLQSATVNHSTHVTVELTDSSGRPASLKQNVTAQLKTVSEEATLTNPSRNTRKTTETSLSVAMTTPSRYEVTYTAVSRGQHKLHVQLNDKEISGSPFTITVYPDCTELVLPVRVVKDLDKPYGIAINSRGEMVVSERGGHRVSIFDIRGQRIREFGSPGDNKDQMKSPRGIAIDDEDNIYVCSTNKLQKFTSTGKLVKCVTQCLGSKDTFQNPHGVTVHDNRVYVCDRNNHRICVFNLDLNFVKSLSSFGKGEGAPLDVQFDTAGNMYVADYGNKKVQKMESSGHFVPAFGEFKPTGLHIADNNVYVSDFTHNYIVVYETSGKFVTSIGRFGLKEGCFNDSYGITSCSNGFLYICDCGNNRVQIF